MCCSLVTKWRIQKRVEDQFNAFASGFHELIPQDLINVFDAAELELLIGGIADIDVDDWKKHTDYRGYTESDQVIQNFWKACLRISDATICLTVLTNSTVYPQLGLGAEIAASAIRNRDVPNTCQRFQRPSRQ